MNESNAFMDGRGNWKQVVIMDLYYPGNGAVLFRGELRLVVNGNGKL